jgi:SAM-dependent methyltransferase
VRTAGAVSDGVIENALEHNLDALRKSEELDRPWRLINPLRSNNYFILHHKTMKVLTVGPRTEAEILNLIGSGFRAENIRGLDLLSYSPFVDIGDMHAMPYDDDSFDVVILGWVLGYSRDNATVAREVLRVARPGAFVLIGCQYNPQTNEELNRAQAIKKEPTRYQHTDDMIRLFDGHIRSILFRHDVHPTMRHRNGDLMVIFDLKA